MDLTGLIPSFGNIGLTVLAFIVALSIIVFIHEMGHYLVGRWTGIRADVFSLGMGPVVTSRVDKHGTRWQLSAFPVGGYVKFRGDQNAASGRGDDAALAAMSEAEKRQTLHGAPLWARAATVAAGPVFNFILSVAAFAVIALSQGVVSDPPGVVRPVAIAGLVNELEPGDEIIAVAGIETPDWETLYDLSDALPKTVEQTYTVRRDGAEVDVLAPTPYVSVVAGYGPGDSAARDAGILEDDVVVALDGAPVATIGDVRAYMDQSTGDPVAVTVLRGDEELTIVVTPLRGEAASDEGTLETRWLIGIAGGAIGFEPAVRTPGLGEALGAGVDGVSNIIRATVVGIRDMIVGRISSCNLSGPIGIAETAGQAASAGGWSFLMFIGVLSTAVGFMNLLPIPVLDGGHLVFHAYEAVVRRPPSERAMNILMTIGLILILGVMMLGITNDLFC